MTITFERPLGPHRDIRELEYLSALHQTDPILRKNASVTAEDVVHYLISRHGVRADLDYVKEHLMPGLAGAMDDGPSSVFDICEIVSILLAPHLKRVSRDHLHDANSFFCRVHEYIIHDVVGSDSYEVPTLNRAFVVKMLETFGEYDVPPQIIDELLAAAGVSDDKGIPFTVETLVKATTSDLQQYKLEWEDSATTHYDDVFSGTKLDQQDSTRSLQDSDEEAALFDETDQVTHIHTVPSLDYVAENFGSKTFVGILWLAVVILYFTYILDISTQVGRVECTRFNTEFGCRIANALVAWLVIFAQLSILGLVFLYLASFGNGVNLNRNAISVLSTLLGMGTIVLATVLSFAFEFQEFIFNTVREDDWVREYSAILVLILGGILLLFQIKTLVFLLVPPSNFENISGFQRFLVPGMAKAELSTKQAAVFKVNRMVNQSIQTHEGTLAGSSLTADDGNHSSRSKLKVTTTTAGAAMLNFQATVDDRESIGGIRWTWKKMRDGTIWNQDGVYLHARLYASNFTQLFICIMYIIIYVGVMSLLNGVYDDLDAEQAARNAPTVSPAPTVDPVDLAVAFALEYTVPVVWELVKTSDQYQNFHEKLWPQVDENVTVPLLDAILDNVPSDSLEKLSERLTPETVQALQDAFADLVIANETEADFNGTAMFNETRYLGDASYFETRYFGESAPSYSPPARHLQQTLDDRYDDLVEYLTPARWQVNLALTLGGICAFAASLFLFLVWIPSSISTIMQFRSGAIGSLRDKGFQMYRKAPDLSTVIFGSTFWGALMGSATVFIFIGMIVFLCVWQVTRPLFINIIAQIIGVAASIALKMLILILLRKILFSGFFRRNPAGANIMMVVMECWNLGLTVLSILQRLIKLLLMTAVYVGRIDTPMLAEGVGNVVGVPIDSYPIQFRKDLLLHDAHRHPYMERLGVMYMLKLRYGSDFADRAGSTWRLVLVMALMPWLRRYRIDEIEDVLPEEGSEQLHALQKHKMAGSRNLGIILDDSDDDDGDVKGDDGNKDDDRVNAKEENVQDNDDKSIPDGTVDTVSPGDSSDSSVNGEDLKKENAVLRQKLEQLEKELASTKEAWKGTLTVAALSFTPEEVVTDVVTEVVT